MQQHDLASLIAELSASFNQPTTAINDAILQQKIAPLLTADLQQAITDPVIAPTPVAPPVDTVNNRVNITTAFPFASALFTHSPVVFNSIRSNISEGYKTKRCRCCKTKCRGYRQYYRNTYFQCY